MKRTIRLLGLLLVLLVVVLGISYVTVSNRAHSHISYNIEDVTSTKVGVLLGTSRYLRDGRQNLYFKYRIDAAERLYKQGMIKFILVSGDNSQKSYNEPRAMYQALVERGIPAEKIVLDFAGFRTLDSMVRAQKVFGQDTVIVISQKFHNERAVCIAQSFGIEAFGYNARDVTAKMGFKTRVREVLARVKMMADLYILNTQPKYLGEKIIIE